MNFIKITIILLGFFSLIEASKTKPGSKKVPPKRVPPKVVPKKTVTGAKTTRNQKEAAMQKEVERIKQEIITKPSLLNEIMKKNRPQFVAKFGQDAGEYLDVVIASMDFDLKKETFEKESYSRKLSLDEEQALARQDMNKYTEYIKGELKYRKEEKLSPQLSQIIARFKNIAEFKRLIPEEYEQAIKYVEGLITAKRPTKKSVASSEEIPTVTKEISVQELIDEAVKIMQIYVTVDSPNIVVVKNQSLLNKINLADAKNIFETAKAIFYEGKSKIPATKGNYDTKDWLGKALTYLKKFVGNQPQKPISLEQAQKINSLIKEILSEQD